MKVFKFEMLLMSIDLAWSVSYNRELGNLKNEFKCYPSHTSITWVGRFINRKINNS